MIWDWQKNTKSPNYKPSCSAMDSRTRLSYSGRLSLYNLQQSIFAPLSKFGSSSSSVTVFDRVVP